MQLSQQSLLLFDGDYDPFACKVQSLHKLNIFLGFSEKAGVFKDNDCFPARIYIFEKSLQGGAFCRPPRCVIVCKDTDNGIAVVVGEFFAENDLSAERIFVERSTPCVDDCVFHRNCDLRDFYAIIIAEKEKEC